MTGHEFSQFFMRQNHITNMKDVSIPGLCYSSIYSLLVSLLLYDTMLNYGRGNYFPHWDFMVTSVIYIAIFYYIRDSAQYENKDYPKYSKNLRWAQASVYPHLTPYSGLILGGQVLPYPGPFASLISNTTSTPPPWHGRGGVSSFAGQGEGKLPINGKKFPKILKTHEKNAPFWKQLELYLWKIQERNIIRSAGARLVIPFHQCPAPERVFIFKTKTEPH